MATDLDTIFEVYSVPAINLYAPRSLCEVVGLLTLVPVEWAYSFPVLMEYPLSVNQALFSSDLVFTQMIIVFFGGSGFYVVVGCSYV